MFSLRLMVSVLFLAGLCALSAGGQPPPGGADQGPGPKQPLGEKVKPADPADAAVAAALRNNPDVKIAQAKVQLAEAELAKAKQAIVLKVMTLNATIQEQKVALAAAEQRVALYAKNPAVMPRNVVLEDRTKLEAAKAALARTEMELKLLTGDQRGKLKAWLGEAAPDDRDPTVAQAPRYLSAVESWRRSIEGQTAASALLTSLAVKGPIPDRIRAALDKPVTLGKKGDMVTFEKALEIFKKAGLDVPIRPMPSPSPEVICAGEELPVGAWLQLFQDIGNQRSEWAFYVRDYGILVANKTAAPKDAPTLTEFWKQKPADKIEPKK